MQEETRKTVQKFMADQFARFAASQSKYQWPWEKARFHELVFCLMTKILDSANAAAIARETMEIFAALNLLEVATLANLLAGKAEPDFREPQPALMLGILQRQRYSPQQAKAAIVTICQAASALQQEFTGKVQKYLRACGKKILAEIPQHFTFTHMSEDKVQLAFTHWLQNVANLPLPCSDPSVREVCQKLGIGLKDFIDVADQDDINVALVDEWAVDYLKHDPREERHG